MLAFGGGLPDNGRRMPGAASPPWTTIVSTIVACGLLAVAGATFYAREARSIRLQRHEDLRSIAERTSETIVEWREDRLAEIRAATAGPLIRTALAESLARPQDLALRARVIEQLQSAHRGARRCAVAAPDGRLLFWLDPSEADLDAAERDQLGQAVLARQTSLGDLARRVSGQVDFVLAAPMLDAAGQPFAVLIESFSADESLYPLLGKWPTPSPSAEVMLARREGEEVVYLNALRQRPDPPLTVRVPITAVNVQAVRVVLTGIESVAEGLDYRGVDVLAAVRPLPGSNWVLVAKVDSAEILGEIRFRAWATLLLVLAGVAAAGSMSAALHFDRHRTAQGKLLAAERARREALEETRATLYGIGDGVIATDHEGRVTRVNPVAEKLTGWRESDAHGRALTEVFHIVNEDTRAEVENPVWRVLRDGKVVGLANHTLLISRDGVERPIADSGAPIHSAEARVIGAVLVFRDQTYERASTSALRASIESWQTTFDAMLDPVMLLGPDGTIRQCNRTFSAVFAGDGPSPVGQPCQDVIFGEGEAAGGCPIHQARDSGARAAREVRVDGKTYYVVTDPIVDDPGGAIRGFVCTMRDITEGKAAEEEHERLQAQLNEKWKMDSVGRLAGGVAHDFNNMLGVILGHAELAMTHLDASHPLSADLQEISRAAKHSADLTSQLLAFARRQPIRPRPLDLNQAVAALLNVLRRLVGENIEVIWNPGAEPWTVKADSAQIDRILINLAANARDAIAGVGVLCIETQNVTIDHESPAVDAVPPGEYVMLLVSDTGVGMSAEVLQHLFEPFYTTKDVGHGTGLGLATVYGAVKQHGGFIGVESQPGRGTTFRLYLPREVGEAAAAPAEGADVPPRGTETVLLVEDELAMLSLGRQILERHGYTVLAAAKPSEALAIARQHAGPIHLLLTDLVMPEMNGRQLKEQIDALRPGIKAVFMSGYTADIIARQGVIEEGIQFLQKPLSVAAMARAVRDALDRS